MSVEFDPMVQAIAEQVSPHRLLECIDTASVLPNCQITTALFPGDVRIDEVGAFATSVRDDESWRNSGSLLTTLTTQDVGAEKLADFHIRHYGEPATEVRPEIIAILRDGGMLAVAVNGVALHGIARAMVPKAKALPVALSAAERRARWAAVPPEEYVANNMAQPPSPFRGSNDQHQRWTHVQYSGDMIRGTLQIGGLNAV